MTRTPWHVLLAGLLALSCGGPHDGTVEVTWQAAKTEPDGLAAMQAIDRLPFFKKDTIARQQSSYDRAGGNDDGFGVSNFLYTEGNGDKVMVDAKGPGTIYCIWFTGFASDANIKIFFDGETTPRVNMLLDDMFSGRVAPFLAPLVANANGSSGGFVSYLPMPFRSSVKITTNGAGTNFFYHVGYHVYSTDSVVATWTGSEDSTAVRNMWNRAGKDPKEDFGNDIQSGTVSVASGGSTSLLDVTGPRSLSSIRLRVPGVFPVVPPQQVRDDGRAHMGTSQFRLAIAPNNAGVTLRRRFDCGIANQRAQVFVDDAFVGEWLPGPPCNDYKWTDANFSIPSGFTAGKSAITVRIAFVSSDNDWNEFRYWALSSVGGGSTITDELDVANAPSESAHAYAITSATWLGSRDAFYPPLQRGTMTDDGRAHRGTSQFTMQLDPDNQGAYLRRRLDFGIANQAAWVFIDDAFVGNWAHPDLDSASRWRDSSFYIPKSFTQGKSSVRVRVQFVSSAFDWNEFYYWMVSIVGGGQLVTDELDVMRADSESRHAYSITTQTFSGTRTFSYPSVAADANKVLEQLNLRITWDSESTPAVDVPLGLLTGVGVRQPFGTRSLLAGLDETGFFYLYFPMPFASRARVSLVNSTGAPVNGVTFELKHKPFGGSFSNVGNFRAACQGIASTIGNDLSLLDVEGAGHLVGVVQSMSGQDQMLEGDERIYVDDSRSPGLHGTGTEDFYNGGWYFDRGAFTTPTHGAATKLINSPSDARIDAYRFFLQDAVPFRKHVRFGIEHGGANEIPVNGSMLALYYAKTGAKAVLSDTINVLDAASESAHGYSITAQTFAGTRTFAYEGDDDTVQITDGGRAHRGQSSFTAAVRSDNTGLVLRRRFDQGIVNQAADVFVDGSNVGTWYVAGGSGFSRWRDDDFLIPAAFTAGKASVRIRLNYLAMPDNFDWNEFTYWVYSQIP